MTRLPASISFARGFAHGHAGHHRAHPVATDNPGAFYAGLGDGLRGDYARIDQIRADCPHPPYRAQHVTDHIGRWERCLDCGRAVKIA